VDSMDSMRTPPKIHRFYGESMDFGWTMISFGKIYPCRSVIVSTLILAHFFTASTLLQVDAIIPSNKYILHFAKSYTYKLISYSSSFLQSHLGMLFAMKKNVIILTTYNIGGYNMDNKIKYKIK
jgi:hypothetical protein